MAYVHLTESERNVIYNMKYLEYSVVDIARSVGKSKAIITSPYCHPRVPLSFLHFVIPTAAEESAS